MKYSPVGPPFFNPHKLSYLMPFTNCCTLFTLICVNSWLMVNNKNTHLHTKYVVHFSKINLQSLIGDVSIGLIKYKISYLISNIIFIFYMQIAYKLIIAY